MKLEADLQAKEKEHKLLQMRLRGASNFDSPRR
jgi:hypothetical protein